MNGNMIDNRLYKIGTLGKPHGVRGEIAFRFDDDVFDRVDADYLFVVVDGLPVPFFIDEYRFRSDDTALMTFSGVDSERKAAELAGCDVYFPRSLADGNDDGTPISKAEITGYKVIDAHTNKDIGTVTALDDSTLNTLLLVRTQEGKELLLPVSDDLIKDVDRKTQAIVLTIAEGLMEM